MRHPIIELAYVQLLGHGRGFRAGFREWRFGIPIDHHANDPSAHGALLRAAAHMGVTNDGAAMTGAFLRDLANEVERAG